jgi:hypothetical protein
MIQESAFLVENKTSTRLWGAVQRFIETCEARGKIAFSMDELLAATGLSNIAARSQLTRLSPHVVRVAPRQNFFLIVRPEQIPMGAPPAFWWLDAYFKFLSQPYYVGLLTAAAEYGSSHQAAQVIQVLTDRPMTDLRIGRIRVQFFVKKTVGEVPAVELPAAYAPLKISTPETTALDLLRYAHRIGGASRAVHAIRDMLPKFSKKRLQDAVAAEAEASNVQRLGFILDQLNRQNLAVSIRRWIPAKPNWVYLEHHKASELGHKEDASSPWRVILNSDIQELS